jgi:hypothetical protein
MLVGSINKWVLGRHLKVAHSKRIRGAWAKNKLGAYNY